MGRVVVTRPLAGNALDRLTAAGHEVVMRDASLPPTPPELRALVAGADGLLCMLGDRIDAALLDGAPLLRVIGSYGVGTDHIDLLAAAACGVAVGNTPDVLTDSTADLAMALMLAAARHLPAAQASVRAGAWQTWDPTGFLGLELRGARLCILGGGRIGRAVATRAEAFGMTTRLIGRGGDLVTALTESNVLSLHAPLTDTTRNIVDAAALSAMPVGGILVNTARGGLVDQAALADALHRGHLMAAAVDVTDPEPLPADHPLLSARNLLVLPHIGSATHRAREQMAERSVDNLLAGLRGEPLPYAVQPTG